MSTLHLTAPHNQLAVATTDVESYRISVKRGTQSGVGASVSGSGAWAKLSGKMSFEILSIDHSRTYQEMKQSYDIGGGVSAFWSWLGIHANASTHKEQIDQALKEITNTQKVAGSARFDLEVTGQYPNVEVDASAYVLVLQVEDKSGNTFKMVSSGDPASDTGAQDQNGNALPTRNNNSTITL